MKFTKPLFSIIFLLTFANIFAQDFNKIELISSKENETTLTFSLQDFNLTRVTSQHGEAFIVSAENTTSLLQESAPDLPKFTTSVIIPDADLMKITVISSKYYDYKENILIAPSKGNLLRNIDPSSVSYEFGEVYQKNEFFPSNIASLNNPFILRDYRAQTVVVNPFQYNPVTKTLRIYTEITVKIESTGTQGENVFERTRSIEKIDNEFNNVYSNFFINYNNFSKYTPLADEGKMLIICNDAWISELDDFVLWKNQRGMQTEIVAKSVAGSTASAIKTYVQSYYNTNGLTHLLLVGDAAQIPTNSGSGLGGESDNAYAYVTGNDHYQEFFVGRFSAESANDVATQVLRTIEYEKGTDLTDGWLNQTMGIASSQGPGDDGEYDYVHQRNLQTDLIGFTYASPTIELFEGNQGGNDASGDPNAASVSSVLNGTGAGIITYTGHGSDNSFVTTGFSNSNVNSLTNANKLPFIWSVACVNGNFVGQTCFAEAWMRATNSGEPTGAIATFMSTINQSWKPPMEGQDEMVDILVESYNNNIKRTFGGLSINGCFKMNETYDSEGDEMTDTWTIFGDPSLLVRTDNPIDMTSNINHQSTIIIGNTNFEVNCSLEGSLACLSKDGEIIGTAKVIGGVASIPVENLTPGDFLDLVVTGFNSIAYIAQVQVIAPDGAYVVSNGYTISDLSGNSNSQADYGETFNVNLTLKNVGVDETSGNVSANITWESDFVANVSNNTFNYQILDANETASSSNVYTITLTNDVPDQTVINFTVNITDGTDNWISSFNITANAPVLQASLNDIMDEDGVLTFTSSPETQIAIGASYNYDITTILAGGNNNGLLDAGENATIVLNTGNNGHADLNNATITLTSTSSYVTVNTSEVVVTSILVGEELPSNFNISIDETTPVGTVVDLLFTITYSDNEQEVAINLPVGLQIEDFESGDFSSYPWTLSGDVDWTIVNTGAQEGTFCAKSGSGESIVSTLEIDMNVTASGVIKFWSKVSSESGYDFLTFYIDGDEKDSWSGDVAWAEHSYSITAGEHTLSWTYAPDYIISTGSDCAWIDFITFPGMSTSSKSSKNITIEAENLPTWLILDDNGDGTANLSGTAPNSFEECDITLTANNGNTPVEQMFSIQVGSVNNINGMENNFSVFPNPNNGLFTLTTSLDNVNYSINDICGKIISVGKINANSTQIDLTMLNEGIYFINLNFDNNIITKKVVIK